MTAAPAWGNPTAAKIEPCHGLISASYLDEQDGLVAKVHIECGENCGVIMSLSDADTDGAISRMDENGGLNQRRVCLTLIRDAETNKITSIGVRPDDTQPRVVVASTAPPSKPGWMRDETDTVKAEDAELRKQIHDAIRSIYDIADELNADKADTALIDKCLIAAAKLHRAVTNNGKAA